MEISIKIPLAVLHSDSLKQPVFRGMETLKRLRGMGIPVIGNIGVEGVSDGRLTTYQDKTHVTYVWDSEPAPGMPAKQASIFSDDDEI